MIGWYCLLNPQNTVSGNLDFYQQLIDYSTCHSFTFHSFSSRTLRPSSIRYCFPSQVSLIDFHEVVSQSLAVATPSSVFCGGFTTLVFVTDFFNAFQKSLSSFAPIFQNLPKNVPYWVNIPPDHQISTTIPIGINHCIRKHKTLLSCFLRSNLTFQKTKSIFYFKRKFEWTHPPPSTTKFL